MRHFLIFALFLGLVSGCSSVHLGPHRIDVQQGNALDQENVARLKPGLSRSQVRFLLGTPLVVDPFHSDRWDYVYVNYKAGKLAEQKHITLFFDGETLARIEGDLPAAETADPAAAAKTTPLAATDAVAASTAAESSALAATRVPEAQPLPASQPSVTSAVGEADSSAATTSSLAAAARTQPAPSAVRATSIVSPLPSPKDAPAYVDPHPVAELSLQTDTNVTQIRPEVMPPFPERDPAAISNSDKPVLDAVSAWAKAWTDNDEAAYFAAYDASFVPQGGGSRADWEKRRRRLFDVGKPVELKVDAAVVEHFKNGTAAVTFNQFYRTDAYRDAVVKQLRMIEREGRWLIAEEKVLSVLKGSKR